MFKNKNGDSVCESGDESELGNIIKNVFVDKASNKSYNFDYNPPNVHGQIGVPEVVEQVIRRHVPGAHPRRDGGVGLPARGVHLVAPQEHVLVREDLPHLAQKVLEIGSRQPKPRHGGWNVLHRTPQMKLLCFEIRKLHR